APYRDFSGVDQLLVPHGGLERATPAHHVRVPAQQCPALALSETSPYAELGTVVQRVRQALVPHWAAATDPFGDVLLGALDEECVRVPVPARRQPRPVRDHFHQSAFPPWFPPVSRPAPCKPPARARCRFFIRLPRLRRPAHPGPRLPLFAGAACGKGRPNIMLRIRLVTQRCQPNRPEIVLKGASPADTGE